MRRAVRASILALVAILVMVGAPGAAVAQTESANAKPTAAGGKPMPLGGKPTPLGGTPTSAVAPATTKASLHCSVGSFTTSCKVGTIQSNRTAFYLYVRVCAAANHYADWQVKDAMNNDIVGQGRVASGSCMGRQINNLYRIYWGWVFNTRRGASMYVSNL
jgi:hypothetical protein